MEKQFFSAEGMIDVHAHILPGVDDGARDLAEALLLVERLRDLGFCGVIATPHFYPGSRPDKAQRVRAAAGQLQAAVAQRWPDFGLWLGQELYYHSELPEALEQGRAMTIAEGDYVLVEFEPSAPFSVLFSGVRNLVSAGYRPVLAHYERYEALGEEGRLLELKQLGCLLQMNYESLQGGFFDREVRRCRRQVKAGITDLLGTDTHRMDRRPPEIGPALEWLKKHLTPKALERLTRKHPERLLEKK